MKQIIRVDDLRNFEDICFVWNWKLNRLKVVEAIFKHVLLWMIATKHLFPHSSSLLVYTVSNDYPSPLAITLKPLNILKSALARVVWVIKKRPTFLNSWGFNPPPQNFACYMYILSCSFTPYCVIHVPHFKGHIKT